MSTYTKSELKEKWEQVLDELSDRIERLKVQSFFKPISIYKLNEKEGKLYFTCPQPEHLYAQAAARYEEDFLAAIEAVFGVPYTFDISEKEVSDSVLASVPGEEAHPNPSYNFETFVAGPTNNLALAACLAVADGYSKNYKPLFLYGGSGLGKTHLMHAIWQYVLQNKPRKKVLYVSSETFTNELIYAIQSRTQAQFREKYRKVDYLLFDDVQFIKDKESTQEELFHTFDVLYNAGKQVIFSSDRAPKDLGGIPDRLLGRFQWGMLVDIQPPDYETRVAVLKNKAILMDLEIDDNLMGIIDVIAVSIQSNIRELESALNMGVNSAALIGVPLTREYAKSMLTNNYSTQEKNITPSLIKKTVASYFNVKQSDLEGPKRNQGLVYPRQISMYLIREYCGLSYPAIGELFGGRDHTTVMHSCEKVEDELSYSDETRNNLDHIKQALHA